MVDGKKMLDGKKKMLDEKTELKKHTRRNGKFQKNQESIQR